MAEKKPAKKKTAKPAPQESLSLRPNQPAVASMPGIEVESDVGFEMDPDTGEPVVWHGVFVNRSDEPVASADLGPDSLFDRLIEANTIPGPSAQPRHREALNACLDKWAAAVGRARAKVALIPAWTPQGAIQEDAVPTPPGEKEKKQGKAKKPK